MRKKFTYTRREGVIDFSLRSNNRRYTLTAGKSIILDVTRSDIPIFRGLNAMGISISDVDNVPVKVVAPVKPVVQEKPVVDEVIDVILPELEEVPVPICTEEEIAESFIESVEPVKEQLPEAPKSEYTVEGLMKKNNLSALTELAISLGIELPEKATKRQIAELICSE